MGQDEIEKNVFDAIGHGDVKMRPRWHFVVRAVFVATGSVVFFLLLVYFASTALATLYRNGVWAAPAFGLSGWLLFLRSLPLVLIGFTLIFVIVIALLARHYAFVYHQPLVYLLLIIAGLTTIASFLIAPTAFNRAIFNYTAGNLPFAQSFYVYEETTPSAVHRGEIIAFTSNGFVLRDIDGDVTATVVFAMASTSFGLGDVVVVFGDENASDTIYPFGAERFTTPW